MAHALGVPTRIELEAWLVLDRPDMSMADAIAEAEAAGNTILDVDHEGRRLLVAYSSEEL